LCDQMSAPDGKGLVEREVIRVVTPGTTFDENILDGKANNFVACVFNKEGEPFGLSYADVTTGEFKVTELKSLKDLEAELMRVMPAELILSEELRVQIAGPVCSFPFEYSKDAEFELKEHFKLRSLEIFGLESRPAIQAAGMLFEYLKETQKTDLGHIKKITYYELSEFMPLNETVIRNLELFYTNRDGRKEGSLINVLDQTVSSMGGRMLRRWLMHPLLKREDIEQRLQRVDEFLADSSLLKNVREILSGIYDIERLLSRLSIGTGNARDLLAMKQSLQLIPDLKKLLPSYELEANSELVELIEKAIAEEPPAIVREGGMIKSGFNTELDELRSISTEGKTFIKDLQERESRRSGINSLKVKYNKVFGYYIEISKANLSSVPEDFIRKQTLVNAERFITPELKEYEEKVLGAENRINELEYELFYKVRIEVVKEILRLQKLAKVIAELDVFSALAFLAAKNNYCKPEFIDSGFSILAGRHPVIEQVVDDFVPNDCKFDEKRNFMLITGPNMGGKSTYLRQLALIALMAQIGSYVPAREARLSIVDRIFSRVGASDNLVRGESTFMVEMTEAAYILNNATERSLIILDEIGRGTSTYDGVSIAWAIMEFLHDKVGAKTLFATHYHELIELAERLDKACNMSVLVRENVNEGVVFLYKVVEGGVDKSYGIEVAKLAGLPVDVVSRARGVLDELETRQIKKGRLSNLSPLSPDQQGLFEDGRKAAGLKKEDLDTLKALKDLDVENLTPMQALQKLHEIKQKRP
ncbi:DNA mismatch repair protein MutS, partial [Candidatus Peregrinibacteria bacterium]|nr:DNA mismatch repair protein MutS [Candidatus Peregrinibacteria bacterium]